MILDVGDGDDGEGMIAQLMDIREPLHTLRNNLQSRLQIDLQQYSFWLQVKYSRLTITYRVLLHNFGI